MQRGIIVLALLRAGASLVVCPQNTTLWCTDDNAVIHAGTPAAGLLFNSRMIQAIWDDYNTSTSTLWAYPDGNSYSPFRQTAEFVGNLTAYKSCGLDAFTVGLQGGGPQVATPPDQPWISSAFDFDGNLDLTWFDRLQAVLTAAVASGLTPIVNLFYQGQVNRLNGTAAITAAVDNTVAWLVDNGFVDDVLMDIANEVGEFQPSVTALQPDSIHVLISRARDASGGWLRVSSSFGAAASMRVPTDSAIAASDFVLLHCNGETSNETVQHIAAVRASAAWRAQPKPIVFNECGTDYTVFTAAVQDGAGWGNYDQGLSNYVDGFQSPPTNWNMSSSPVKKAFFGQVAALTGSQARCDV